jgi:long-chain acyl-CoA synthetase
LPIPGLETKLIPLPGASQMAVDETGELAVRGESVMSGYWRDPAATAEVLEADGWFVTGDVARTDCDGRFFIVDRKKDVIITAGFKVYPAELEQVLATHPAVGMVAVAAMPDAEKGELAIAYIVLRSNTQVTPSEMESRCRLNLASYKAPGRFILVDDLPKTSTGKIMRRALRAKPALVEENNP